ncbi:MAG: hypothetical protein V4505_18980 [Pseudomonadota bacterium]
MPDVLCQHELDESLLLVVKLLDRRHLSRRGALRLRYRLGRKSNVGQYIEEVAVFCLDESLHVGQSLPTEAPPANACAWFVARRRSSQETEQYQQ